MAVDFHRRGIREYCGFFICLLRAILGLIIVYVEHLETIHGRREILRLWSWYVLFFRSVLRFWQRLRAFIRIPFNPHALVCSSRHHAGSGEEGIVDRVERDVGVTVLERNRDDNNVVDMVQVTHDKFLIDIVGTTYDDVSSRSWLRSRKSESFSERATGLSSK